MTHSGIKLTNHIGRKCLVVWFQLVSDNRGECNNRTKQQQQWKLAHVATETCDHWPYIGHQSTPGPDLELVTRAPMCLTHMPVHLCNLSNKCKVVSWSWIDSVTNSASWCDLHRWDKKYFDIKNILNLKKIDWLKISMLSRFHKLFKKSALCRIDKWLDWFWLSLTFRLCSILLNN